RRNPLAHRARGNLGQRPEPSGAQRADDSPNGTARTHRTARDQNARHCRRRRSFHHSFGSARRHAARVQQGGRERGRRRLHAGAIAPMSLVTYEEARPWARSIKQKVTAREMPPWYIDRHIGITKFKDDPSLTDAEIATIVKWVDSGAPAGSPADMPKPRQFA